MLRFFQPTIHVSSLDEISVEELRRAGIKGIILDLDNTVTKWRELIVDEKISAWLSAIIKTGINVCMVSNSSTKSRVAIVADHLGIPYLYRATKPRRRAFLKAMEMMGTGVKDTTVIGDQLFTDILGGNRLNLCTILVSPISDREFIGTKVLRMGERLMRWLIKKNKVINPTWPKPH